MPGRSDYYRMMIEYRGMRKQEIRDRLIASAEAESDPALLWNDLEAEQDRLLEMEKQFSMYERGVLSGQKSAGTSGMDVVKDLVKPMARSGGGSRGRSVASDIDRQNQRLAPTQKQALEDVREGATLSDIWFGNKLTTGVSYRLFYDKAQTDTEKRQVLRNLSDTFATANSKTGAWADSEIDEKLGAETPHQAAQFSAATMDAFRSQQPDTGAWRTARSTMGAGAASGLASGAVEEQFAYLGDQPEKIAQKQAEIAAQQQRVGELREQIRTGRPADIDLADIERRAAIEYTEAYGTPRGKRLLERERQRIGREEEFGALPEDVRSEIEDDPRLARIQGRVERSGREAVPEGRLLDLDAAKGPQTDPLPEGPAAGADPSLLQALSVAKAGSQENPVQIVSGDQFRTLDGQSKPTSEITGLDLAKWALSGSFGANEEALTNDVELDAARELTNYIRRVDTDSPDAMILMTRLGEYIGAEATPPPSQMLEGLRQATDATGEAAGAVRGLPGVEARAAVPPRQGGAATTMKGLDPSKPAAAPGVIDRIEGATVVVEIGGKMINLPSSIFEGTPKEGQRVEVFFQPAPTNPKAIVDRVERDLAVVEIGDQTVDVPLSVFPEGAKEGAGYDPVVMESPQGPPPSAPQQAVKGMTSALDIGAGVAAGLYEQTEGVRPLQDSDVIKGVMFEAKANKEVRRLLRKHGELVGDLARKAKGSDFKKQEILHELKNIFEEDWKGRDVKDAALTLYQAFAELAKANP